MLFIRCDCPAEVVRVLSVLKFTAVKREEMTEDGKAPAKTKEVKAKKPGDKPVWRGERS